MGTPHWQTEAYFETPPDQRCLSIDEFTGALKARRDEIRIIRAYPSTIEYFPDSDCLTATVGGPEGSTLPVRFNGPAFEQLCALSGFDAGMAGKLPPQELARPLRYMTGQLPAKPLQFVGSTGSETLIARAVMSHSYAYQDSYTPMVAFIAIAQSYGLGQMPVWETLRTNKPGGLFLGTPTGTAGPKFDVAVLGDPRSSIVVKVPSADKGEETLFPIAGLAHSEFGWGGFKGFNGVVRDTCGNLQLMGFQGREWAYRHAGDLSGRINELFLPQFRHTLATREVDLAQVTHLIEKAADMLVKWDDCLETVITATKLPKPAAVKVIHKAIAEEGEARTLWQLVNGATACARDCKGWQDSAPFLAAGDKLLKLAA